MRTGERYRCDCCGVEVWTASTETRKWDWFKGYLERIHHYCEACKDSDEARAMFEKSRMKPSNAEVTGDPHHEPKQE